MVVDPQWRDETMKVVISEDRVIRMSKRIPEYEFSGTYIGMTAFSGYVQKRLFTKLEDLILTGHENAFFNVAVQQLADEGVRVGFTSTGDLPWAEIDDPGDLAFARLHVFSKLTRAHLRHSPSMDDILAGTFATSRCQLWRPQSTRVVNWNIDRGLHLPAITEFLASQQADVLILQEVDVNAKRTHLLNVAKKLARTLRMNHVFGREFEQLSQESRTSPAYQGQATLSRWPLRNAGVIRFRCQSGFWRPRWFLPRTDPFQQRLGGRIALATEVDLLESVGRP